MKYVTSKEKKCFRIIDSENKFTHCIAFTILSVSIFIKIMKYTTH